MAHKTRTYIVENLLSYYKEFVDYYNKLEFGKHITTYKAGQIAESLLNLPEYIHYEIGVKTGFDTAKQFRDSIRTSQKNYEIVCDLANVVKHNRISRDGKTFTDINDIKESIAIVKYRDIFGKYYATRKILEINLLDGKSVEVSDLLLASILLWLGKVVDLNLIPEVPKLPEVQPKFIPRKVAKLANEVTILGNIGEYMEEQFRAMVYRKNINQITDRKPDEKFGKYRQPTIVKIGESIF